MKDLKLLDLAKPMAEWINSGMPSGSILRNFLPEYIAPLILVLFNSVIIPQLVDLVAWL